MENARIFRMLAERSVAAGGQEGCSQGSGGFGSIACYGRRKRDTRVSSPFADQIVVLSFLGAATLWFNGEGVGASEAGKGNAKSTYEGERTWSRSAAFGAGRDEASGKARGAGSLLRRLGKKAFRSCDEKPPIRVTHRRPRLYPNNPEQLVTGGPLLSGNVGGKSIWDFCSMGSWNIWSV
ncbi:hypothetical protein BD779DRAFT_1468815 [Infundibulicybe gibba]|nr:hypothetical protein BD779DRAFT_1468815 [Infundibulicybe gibba]